MSAAEPAVAAESLSLRDADRLLLRFLAPDERADAGDIALPLRVLAPGEDEIARVLGRARAFGALVLDGMLLESLRLGNHQGLRVLGPGDLLSVTDPRCAGLVTAATMKATAETRLALLEREFLLAARRWPLLIAGLHAREAEQCDRLRTQMLICQMPRVDERVLALMWLLSESWGQRSPVGMRLPLGLTHGAIGGLIGARRPTVTLAIGELVDRGALLRQDGGWLLLQRPGSAQTTGEGGRPLDAPRLIPRTGSEWTRGSERQQEGDELGLTLIEQVARLRAQHERNLSEMRDRLHRMRALNSRMRSGTARPGSGAAHAGSGANRPAEPD